MGLCYSQLSTEERHIIATMRALHLPSIAIAGFLRRDRSTISREVARNRSRHDGGYRAAPAGEKTRGRRSRSRRNQRFGKKAFRPVEQLLAQKLSPEQIVGRARVEGVEIMSHETIYQWIIKDRQAGGDLWRNLRHGQKKKRKRYGHYDSRGRLADKKMISERPAIIEDRSRLGDWEIDTVRGSTKACVVTIVDRLSGQVRIGKLPDATAAHTTQRTIKLLTKDKPLIKSITADNGTEFHSYKTIAARLEVPVYFATPHHAWERGTNENTNGLIRQYLPKRTNLSTLTQHQCSAIANVLNNRPRKRLGFKTPNEVYYAASLSRRHSASCGKLFGSCPRKRNTGYTSIINNLYKDDALQT